MNTLKTSLARRLMCLTAALIATGAASQEKPFPNKPFTILAPYAVGGTADVLARIVGDVLRKETGQPVMVDVKPGAGGSIGGKQVARSVPDGYTLLLNSSGVNSVAPAVYRDFKPEEMLSHVTVLVDVPFVFVANNNFPAKNLPDFIKYAKQKPSAVRVGNASLGSHGHLTQVLFDKAAGIELTSVPYKGSTPAITDLLGGHVEAVITNVEALKQFIDANRITPLFITSKARSSALPQVPTATELGLPFESVAWFGISVAKGTPPQVVAALHSILAKGLDDKEVRAKLQQVGMTQVLSTPSDTTARLQAEGRVLVKVAESLNLPQN